MNCPCCGKPRSKRDQPLVFNGKTYFGVSECAGCKAIYTTTPIYLGESYTLVKPFFIKPEFEPEQGLYYDFETLGSDGLGRRHGWFDPKTRLIIQVG